MKPVYLDHFGLARAPFDLMPQGDFLFAGMGFRKALDALRHIVAHEPALTVVTGEVGVGKTMLAKSLLADLPAGVAAVFLDNPTFSRDEILQALAEACGVAIGESQRVALAALRHAAIARRQGGRPLVIVIDEAHLMRPESVEEVRLLTNLEHDGQRLFSILLLGQPELKDVLLARHDLRQVRDRVKYWIELDPMPAAEVGVYLDHRLRLAGWKGGEVFPPSIARNIWRKSGGRPRRINLIADRCLLAAYLDDTVEIGAAQLAKALRETASGDIVARPGAERGTPGWHPGRRRLAARLALMAAAGIAVISGCFFIDCGWPWRDSLRMPAASGAATRPSAPMTDTRSANAGDVQERKEARPGLTPATSLATHQP